MFRVSRRDVLKLLGVAGLAAAWHPHATSAGVIVPGSYGMKSVQWLTEIEAVDRDYKGYYQQKGWTDEATVKSMSRIDLPGHGSRLKGSDHLVQGLAFAGIRGVSQVEVSVDEGKSWHRATLHTPLSVSSWVFWHYTLMVRGHRWNRKIADLGGGRTGSRRSLRPPPGDNHGRGVITDGREGATNAPKRNGLIGTRSAHPGSSAVCCWFAEGMA